jgi:hypothetical protein
MKWVFESPAGQQKDLKIRSFCFFNGLRKLPADFVNATQFYPEKTEQKSRRPPGAEGGSASRGVGRFYVKTLFNLL